MAIDSAAKRASATQVVFPPLMVLFPDGTIDQGDRQAITHIYSGVAVGSTGSANRYWRRRGRKFTAATRGGRF